MQKSDFAPTRWTLVLEAQGHDSAARTALSSLCEAYYAPVVAFLRAERRDEETARELAHEFFARLLAHGSVAGADRERGRFRSYLLGAVKHFLADTRKHDNAAKRGSGIPPDRIGTTTHEDEGLRFASPADSERAFDRQWALTIIARGLATIEAELREAGKVEQFNVLKPWLTGGNDALCQADAARQLDLGETAIKVAIHRLRLRFREAIKSEISQTVPADSDVDDELRYLLATLLTAAP